MKDPIFVSYYTVKTPYEKEIKGLIATLEQFDLEYDIFPKRSLGTWAANCSMISTVCREALEKYRDRPVVFLPADTKIKKRPALLFDLPEDIDFATRYAVWHKRFGLQLNTSILYFAPTEKAMALVLEWERRCQRDRTRWDQIVLQEIIDNEFFPGLNWFNVPEEYCRIFDNPTGDTGDPVIVAYQASRRHRKTINQRGASQ